MLDVLAMFGAGDLIKPKSQLPERIGRLGAGHRLTVPGSNVGGAEGRPTYSFVSRTP